MSEFKIISNEQNLKNRFLKLETGNLKLNLGFTLIEVMVTVAGFSLIAVGLISLVSGILTASGRQSALLADSDQARKLAFGISSELRNAVTSATGAYSLEQADDQQIIFYSNLDSDPEPERIRYFVQNGKLYRGVVDPSGNPLAYNIGTEQISVVQNGLANGSLPLFFYYDGNFSGSGSSLSQPAAVTAVKFVKISLLIFNKGGVKNNNTYAVTAGAAIRNLKTNLGN